jgi:hypothetical protein
MHPTPTTHPRRPEVPGPAYVLAMLIVVLSHPDGAPYTHEEMADLSDEEFIRVQVAGGVSEEHARVVLDSVRGRPNHLMFEGLD